MRFGSVANVKKLQELASELEFTKTALEFTKSSLRLEAQKTDDLKEKLRKLESLNDEPIHCATSILPPQISEDVRFRLDEYEKKIQHLSILLTEEELKHKQLITERDITIEELRKANLHSCQSDSSTPRESLSPLISASIPESKVKVKILEQRIVEMTIALEEKDRTIFNLECEADSMKIELNKIRHEGSRVLELEAMIEGLNSELNLLRQESSHTALCSDDISEESSVAESNRMEELEATISELDALVLQLRAENEKLTSTRDEAEALRSRVSELEEQLEISEMNRQILRENFLLENEEKMRLLTEMKLIDRTFQEEDDLNQSGASVAEANLHIPHDEEKNQMDVVEEPVVDSKAMIDTQEESPDLNTTQPLEATIIQEEEKEAGEDLLSFADALQLVEAQKIQLEELTTQMAVMKASIKESEQDRSTCPDLIPVSPPSACAGCFFVRRKRLVH